MDLAKALNERYLPGVPIDTVRKFLNIIIRNARRQTVLTTQFCAMYRFMNRVTDYSNSMKRIVKKAPETVLLECEGSPDSLCEYIHIEDTALGSIAALSQDFNHQSVVLTS